MHTPFSNLTRSYTYFRGFVSRSKEGGFCVWEVGDAREPHGITVEPGCCRGAKPSMEMHKEYRQKENLLRDREIGCSKGVRTEVKARLGRNLNN